MTENEISYLIRKCIFKVYNKLGPGLFESVYETILIHELRKEGLEVSQQKAVPLYYENIYMDLCFRIDILVENKVIVEIKSVANMVEVHHKQLITYLKLTNLKLGLLVNFNTDEIAQSIIRKVNNLK